MKQRNATAPIVGTLLGAIVGAVLAAACGSGSEPTAPKAPAEWPTGTVLVVDGRPVTADEVERLVPMIELIEPEFVHRDHLRKIISNVTIPTAAAGALVPDDRQAAYQRAEELLATARETGHVPTNAPDPLPLSGHWKDVGMVSWFEAMELEPGAFSALHETPGAWTFFQFVGADAAPGEFDAWTKIEVVRYDVRYLPTESMRALIGQAAGAAQVDVIDPEWEAAVPPRFFYPQSSTARATGDGAE